MLKGTYLLAVCCCAMAAAFPATAFCDQPSIKEALNQKFEVEFESRSLKEAMDEVARLTKIPIRFDDIDEDAFLTAKISGQFKNISARSVLLNICRHFDVVYIEAESHVFVSQGSDAFPTRLYDVRDLLNLRGNLWPERHYGEEIVELVRNVSPDSFDQHGGEGSIQLLRGQLVVRNEYAVHLEIEALLRAFRTAKRIAESADRKEIPTSGILAISSAEQEALDALGKPITYQAKDVSFHEVIAQLSSKTGVTILPGNNPKWGQGGLVTLSATNQPLDAILTKLFDDYGVVPYGFSEAICMGYNYGELRAYPIADLIGRSNQPDQFGEYRAKSSPDSITDLIQSTISCDSWDVQGGECIIMDSMFDVLIIRQTRVNHDQVAALLTALREQMEEPVHNKSSRTVERARAYVPAIDLDWKEDPATKRAREKLLHVEDPFAAPKSTDPPGADGDPSAPGVQGSDGDAEAVDSEKHDPEKHAPDQQRLVIYFVAPSVPMQLEGPPWPRYWGLISIVPVVGGQFPDDPKETKEKQPKQQTSKQEQSKPTPVPVSPSIPATDLLELIQELVEPNSWDEPNVLAKALPGRILIRQPDATHLKIRELLIALQVFRGATPGYSSPHGPTGPPVSFKSGGYRGGLGGGGFGGGGGMFSIPSD